jgi:hypothetical protein
MVGAMEPGLPRETDMTESGWNQDQYSKSGPEYALTKEQDHFGFMTKAGEGGDDYDEVMHDARRHWRTEQFRQAW